MSGAVWWEDTRDPVADRQRREERDERPDADECDPGRGWPRGISPGDRTPDPCPW